MEKHAHGNAQPCYGYQVARGSDDYGKPAFDRYDAKEPYEEPYGKDSYGNVTYEDKDEYGNYQCAGRDSDSD